MKLVLQMLLVVAFAFGQVKQSQANDRKVTFTGQASKITEEFEVQGPWLLRWRFGSSFPDEAGLEVSLLNAKTGLSEGIVLKDKSVGTGLRLFEKGGRYQFRVSATLADWLLRVEPITDDEARTLIHVTPSGSKDWIRRR